MRALVLVLVVLLAVVLVPQRGQAQKEEALTQLALYDDFAGSVIDPKKWFGSEARGTESRRQIVSGKLEMFYRGYGGTSADSGAALSDLSANFATSSLITAVKAQVKIIQTSVVGCASNPEPTSAGIQLHGWFFNAGNTAPTSAINDVGARIRMWRNQTDPVSSLRVDAAVERCTDAACATPATIGSANLGTASVGSWVKIWIDWNKDKNRFTFTKSGVSAAITYSQSDTQANFHGSKRLQIWLRVPNCTATPRPAASALAYFDDVYVNTGAVPSGR